MHRWLLALAGLAAGCAATPPREAAQPIPARSGGVPVAMDGFEKQPGETVTALDLTQDGKPDVWRYTAPGPGGGEVLLRSERDLNADTKVDTWERYGPDGDVVRVVHDLDFDGRPDAALFYDRGQLVKTELASGFEGVLRTFSHYEQGRLVRKERETRSDGKLDRWEYWEGGEIDRIGVDRDGDGEVDGWEVRRPGAAVPGSGQK